MAERPSGAWLGGGGFAGGGSAGAGPAAGLPAHDPAVTGPVRASRTADQAPGDPGWTRAFADTTAAQREPLADGADQLPGIRPEFWHGPTSERFADVRDRLAEAWRAVHDTHDGVARRIQRYNLFVHDLQHLWEADRGNPVALRHTAELHRRITEELAAELLAGAAELDAVAVPTTPAEPVDANHPPTAPDDPRPAESRDQGPPADRHPDPSVAPRDPMPADARQVPVDPPVVPAEPPHEQHLQPVADPPDQAETPTSPAQRYQLTEKLGVQLLAGSRVLRIPWEAVRR